MLEYLSYGKPVVSTWTEGLNPEYRQILTVVEEETPKCLAETIKSVLQWNEIQKKEFRKRLNKFMGKKMWRVQADRLHRWLENEVFKEKKTPTQCSSPPTPTPTPTQTNHNNLK